jgi:dUTP pyrophosphatase
VFKLKVLENGKAPVKAHSGDAGFDVFVKEQTFVLKNSVTKVPLGFAVEIPENYMLEITDKSGIASKGLFTVGGIVDSTYRGEVHCVIINSTNEDVIFEKHQKVAQMIIFPCYTRTEYEIVSELSETNRGSGGFGSTGNF